MISGITLTEDGVIVAQQKLYKDIHVTTEFGMFHNAEWGIYDSNLIRLVASVNRIRIIEEKQNTEPRT